MAYLMWATQNYVTYVAIMFEESDEYDTLNTARFFTSPFSQVWSNFCTFFRFTRSKQVPDSFLVEKGFAYDNTN